MGTEDTPETIRSALAYFQRGGLVEMTERTLAEMSEGKSAVECDADGVLALCHLAAEALAARARRDEATEDAALIQRLRDFAQKPFYTLTTSVWAKVPPEAHMAKLAADRIAAQAAEITALRARVAGLEGALRPFAEAARNFEVTIGPDGIDDDLTVEAVICGIPERVADLSTADFSRAGAALSTSAQEARDAD